MIFLKRKDLKARLFFSQDELKTLSTRFLFTNYLSNRFVNKTNKKFALSFFDRCGFVGHSKVKIIRRCVLTGRARGSIRPFGVSRIVLKDLIVSNRFAGLKKFT